MMSIDKIPLDAEVTLMLLVSLQFILTLGVLVIQTWRLLRRQPPLHEVYATKTDLGKMRGEMETKFQTLERRLDTNAQADEQRAIALHERVNLILSAVSRIEGVCQGRQRKGSCDA